MLVTIPNLLQGDVCSNMNDGWIFYLLFFSVICNVGKKNKPKTPEANLDEMEVKIHDSVSSQLIPHLDVAVYLRCAHKICFTLPRQVL